ncbi:MAG: SDR family oxidoreductase [Anaerolineae bacterium]|nr:SDR family oxidoreductase [Anaerolineae bacterium]
MEKQPTIVITGASRGIGKYLAQHYLGQGFQVVGCSRRPVEWQVENYRHYCLDVADETSVKTMFTEIRQNYKRLDVLINNAGIAAMNHTLLTPLQTAQNILNTNFMGTFLFCREAARLMQRAGYGRIVNFVTIATPLKLEGEAVYAASKAAVLNLTQILARELAAAGITVNAVGPGPVKTDLIRAVPEDKLNDLLNRQAIHRFCEFEDIANVIDFFIRPQSSFVTGQVLFLGGV